MTKTFFSFNCDFVVFVLIALETKTMAISCFAVPFIVVVLIFPPEIACLSCYSCTSQDSWEDCNSKMNKTACPSGSPNCVNGSLTCGTGDDAITVFYKRCGAQGQNCGTTRSDSPSCPASSTSWSFSSSNKCCTGNNCNSASSQKFSGAITGMCLGLALWALTYMY